MLSDAPALVVANFEVGLDSGGDTAVISAGAFGVCGCGGGFGLGGRGRGSRGGFGLIGGFGGFGIFGGFGGGGCVCGAWGCAGDGEGDVGTGEVACGSADNDGVGGLGDSLVCCSLQGEREVVVLGQLETLGQSGVHADLDERPGGVGSRLNLAG